ncbi:MAG: PQQ-binding-like beta-propeller repeat protein [Planctomycetes bacterium]|nr:PQQ-binding-like beta-propeller repeat protein [Planctomycetota bacterium]
MSRHRRIVRLSAALAAISLAAAAAVATREAPGASQAREILDAARIRGGLIIHVGCGDGKVTAALHAGEEFLVQGLAAEAADVEKARAHVRSLGLYGPVSIDLFRGNRLPYVDDLANLVVVEDPRAVAVDEVTRILCPEGVALVRRDGKWERTVKPRPEAIDEWTHYLHDPSNNAVAHDSVVGPPHHLQWVGSPRWTRHHDRMSSLNAAVSAGGRVFYILDEATPASILAPPRWALIARDAFNGTILWKRKLGAWHTHLFPLKSGPAQLPRRLVAAGDRVYVTMSLDSPLSALDAATGETVRTYDDTRATEEVLVADGMIYALVDPRAASPDAAGAKKVANAFTATNWDEALRRIAAIRAESGEPLWNVERRVLPGTLAVARDRIFFHDGGSVVCLDRRTGDESWRSEPIERSKVIPTFYLPTLVVYEDVVLFAGGETAGLQTGSWYMSGKDTMTALDAESGKKLWSAYHPPSGYRSPEDLFVVDGLVWSGETTSGRAVGVFTGRDPRTGKVEREFQPQVDTYWFHHRCYRGKATENYLLVARTGTEFIDVRKQEWIPHHWFRGACLYGVMPANGLIYAPPNPCACYLETKQAGFNALARGSDAARIPEEEIPPRLETGAAYGESFFAYAVPDDWPTYRHDAARSGRASTEVPATLAPAWRTKIDGELTAPVIACGKVLIASVDAHEVHALDAATGQPAWRFAAGGRIDSPPTVHLGRAIFGSADGYVYCLRLADGAFLWRFRAAPFDERLTAFEQVESVWPVPGNILVQDGILYFVAGRSMFLDGGIRLWRLDPETGRPLSETVLDEREAETDKDLQDFVSWLNMPPGLPDILSSDGKLVYMRSQPFRLDGTRLPLVPFPRGSDADRGAPPATQLAEHTHLFCPTGFGDNSYWHRTYWLFGSTFVSGWCGYYLAGQVVPSGRILAFDDERVYGFGRKPQYYRWTTPIEHHLFAADRKPGDVPIPRESRIRVTKSASLNPAGKSVTVEAWVKAEKPGGVVIARGGANHGYALCLQGGKPRFAVRIDKEPAAAVAKESIVGRWAHIAGVLTPEKELRLFVDGKLAASAKAPGLIAADPAEAMEIGADEGSIVGGYDGPFPFTGLIDELRIYHRALSEAEIAGEAKDDAGLVLAYSFDAGDAADASGKKNDGEVSGAVVVDGKVGRAMRFTGAGAVPPSFKVRHAWTKDQPILVRAMVLAGGTLFIAGPPDVVDEPDAFRDINDPKVQALLADQAAAIAGEKGAALIAVSAADGEPLANIDLESPPVFDGMAAAGGRLYLTTMSGEVICFRGKE